MKTAVIGSRNINVSSDDIEKYLPDSCSEIVSGGANGVDACAKDYAVRRGISYTEFLPEYNNYRRGAPIVRNREIVDYSDNVLAFWDGASRGTLSVIKYCITAGKPCTVIYCKAPFSLR